MLFKKDSSKILFFRESSFKVAELLFNHPSATFHLRKIAKETKLSTTAVVQAIVDLKNADIILVEHSDFTKNVKANVESDIYKFYKRVFNLYRLERHHFIETLKQQFQAKTIILFGSFARGEDIESSDIDLLIISNRKENIIPLLHRMEKELNRPIHLHFLESIDKSEPEFKNALANGIVLHGYLKII